MEKRLSEASTYEKKANEALKTGLFKWNKDYASAAMNYDEAVKLYRLGKDFSNARRIYEKLIQVNEKLNEYLEKNGHYVHACELYDKLINDLEDPEHNYVRNEVVTNYVSLLVNILKFGEAAKHLHKEIEMLKSSSNNKANLNLMALSVICLYLIMNDIDKADDMFNDYIIHLRDFVKSREVTTAEKLIDAYIDGQQKEFMELTNRPPITSIFPLNIVKQLKKVVVKACPSKRKVINIDDMVDLNDMKIIQENNTNNNGGGNNNFETQIEEKITKIPETEEEKKKALEDFMS